MAGGSLAREPQASHFIALTLAAPGQGGAAHPRRDRGEQQPGDQERDKDPSPASPIFGRKPAEDTLFPFRLGNSLRGWSLHWFYDSFPSSRAKFSIWGRQGGFLKGKWPKHHPWWQMAIREEDLRVQVPPLKALLVQNNYRGVYNPFTQEPLIGCFRGDSPWLNSSHTP